MSLVDLLNDLPSDHSARPRMQELLTQLAAGLQHAQDAQSGMWYQVVDQGNRSDNWLETSGSAMFVYALKVGVDSGYLDASYLMVAQHGFEGLRKQVSETNQTPSIHNAVQGMGVQNDYAGYVNQSKLTDSPHGLCAILLAAAEMEAL
jgi:unsaturated rhamnogalacturonyl hydrolase